MPQLPPEPTRLLDRTEEMATIQRLLLGDGTRLVTLTGPAGVGKTRLAREAGLRVGDSFAHGVAFVDLTPTHDPDLVPARIVRSLGLPDSGREAPLNYVTEYLRERHILLIIDNFEHILPAAGGIAELLAAAPFLRILVTSRASLRLRWEQIVRIFPFPVPDDSPVLPIERLVEIPSVALFVERAQAQRADFIPSEQQAPLLIQLTRQLDGLPLAIELAAANMNTLPLAVIARRLDQRLQNLRWDAQDLPDRQRSLHAAIGWSYDLLPPSEQRLFRRLGVFAGQVALDAIQAVMGEGDEAQTLAGMMSLAEKSLVLPGQSGDEDPELSFRMLETVRQFAREQLTLCGEFEEVSRAHARYFMELADQADPQLRRHDQLAWFLRLESEHDNLRASLRWSIDHGEDALGLRLAGALGYFWWRRGYHSEGWHWLEEALETAPDLDPALSGRALMMAGWLLALSGDLTRARALLVRGLSAARQSDDSVAITRSLNYLGMATAYSGDLSESERLLQEALKRAQEMQDDDLIGVALAFLAYIPWMQGDYREAAALSTRAISHCKATGNMDSAAIFQYTLALELQQLGDAGRALQLLREGFQTSLAFNDRWLLSLGAEATLLFVGEEIDAESRARLLGAVDTLVQATGTLPGMFDRVIGQRVESVRAPLEQEGLAVSYRAGRGLSFTQIVDLAMGLLNGFSQTLKATEVEPREQPPESPLSVREWEVLRLVAEGFTSKQIGKQLFLSPRTVDHHLTSAFNKLGVETRAQAVAVATRQGLL